MAAWFRSMLIEDESSGKKNGYDARAADQVVEATSGFDVVDGARSRQRAPIG